MRTLDTAQVRLAGNSESRHYLSELYEISKVPIDVMRYNNRLTAIRFAEQQTGFLQLAGFKINGGRLYNKKTIMHDRI